ncbi:hypothetical protein GCM10027169_07820 [Gordonia jinhuaensis]|uniref:S-formylglutathione hydrolase FrmB n=1 Tax=Gordonia jinhuaensis TaxID=1517702 RepID=A0A916SZM9_9ACTN|nr:alpha/beta hydrolase family protein [Gordonia jinhuaensis]GGB21752.1 hypothetical protein GCM10011489_07420 [Gordonia jinhuaensis]
MHVRRMGTVAMATAAVMTSLTATAVCASGASAAPATSPTATSPTATAEPKPKVPAPAPVPVPVESAFPNAKSAPDGSHIVSVSRVSPRRFIIELHSAAMNRTVGVQIIRPADTSVPAPSLYLLNGAEDGRSYNGNATWKTEGDEVKTWETATDVVDFMADKHVNVVTMMDGAYTYFSDWLRDDPKLGRNKWQTLLTKELPPIIDSALQTTGRNAIAGLSMSATSALQIAESAPGLYRSVGSFSGCSDIQDPVCAAAVAGVTSLGGANLLNMWGAPGSPTWIAHDPTTADNLVKLRGSNVVITTGNGKPGIHDTLSETDNDASQLWRQKTIGGNPESLVADSTHRVQAKFAAAKVPATFMFRGNGTHSWAYWQDDLHDAWPSFAASLGIPTTGQ